MKNKFVHQVGPFPCFFGCGAHLANKFNNTIAQGWEWFTGYGEHTIHFCPACRNTRQSEVDWIRKSLNVKPDNYPATFSSFPEPLK